MQSSTKERSGTTSDNRFALYRNLHEDFLEKEETYNRVCSQTVLRTLFEDFKPRSVLDVGCGLGTWLSTAQALGAAEIYGIEGPWLNKNRLRIDPASVAILDLELPFDLNRRFDLVLSLEVAEHLSKESAESFVQSLVRHGDVVLFSAAIPFQGGHNHLNEQWQRYWADLFSGHDYRCLDFLRRRLWENGEVFGHIRQNLLLFVSERLTTCPSPYQALFESHSLCGPLSVVHPETHLNNIHLMDHLMQIKKKYDSMMDFLMEGGTFIAFPKDRENLDLKRVSTKSETSKGLNEQGMRRFQAKDLEGAERDFRRAIAADPDFAESYNNLAVVFWQRGWIDQAFESVREALQRNPCHVDAALNFGTMCRIDGRKEEAERALEAFLNRCPESEEVRKLLNGIVEESEWTEMKESPWNGAQPS